MASSLALLLLWAASIATEMSGTVGEPLPELQVLLELPVEFSRLPEGTLTVRRRLTDEVVRRLAVDPGGEVEVRVGPVPAEPLAVRLELPPFSFEEWVDASDGADATVVFSPRPIRVVGRVFRGDEGHPARLAFKARPDDEPIEVETDVAGGYEALFFSDLPYLVEVTLEGVETPAHREYLAEGVAATPVLDFHLPAASHVVRVVDAGSGEAVAGATVRLSHHLAGRSRGSVWSRSLGTDAEGRAVLPPLLEGKATLSVTADGYHPSAEVTFTVEEGESEGRERVVRLEPRGAGATIRWRLPDGRPASGAEAVALRSLDVSTPAWSGRADADGELSVPRELAGALLLVRHPEAGSAVERFVPPPPAAPPHSATLPSPSPPFSVRVVDRREEAVPWARIILWVDGMALTGHWLGWLAGGRFAADAEGVWRAARLPAGPLQIAAVAPSVASSSGLPLPESVASTVAPGAGIVELVAVE